MLPMLHILEGFGLGGRGPVLSILDIAKDRSPRLVLVPLQPDAVCVARDNQVVDLRERRKLVLEGIIGKGQGYSKEDRAANEILALVKGKFLWFPLPPGSLDMFEVEDEDDDQQSSFDGRRKDLELNIFV